MEGAEEGPDQSQIWEGQDNSQVGQDNSQVGQDNSQEGQDNSHIFPNSQDDSFDYFIQDDRDPYDSARYLTELVKDMRTLDAIQLNHPETLRSTYSLLANEIDRVWTSIYIRTLHSDHVYYSRPFEESPFTMHEKVLIPEHQNCKVIGRILGPRGISVKQLEAQTGCRILIRGKGSVKDPRREVRLRNRVGWEHLSEPLHVLVSATDTSHDRCLQKLAYGVHSVRLLLCSTDDEHKRRQLVQLAIINGTYRRTQPQ